jgi:hypothetical protein
MWFTSTLKRVGLRAVPAATALVGTIIAHAGVGYAADGNPAIRYSALGHPAAVMAPAAPAMSPDVLTSIGSGSPAYSGIGVAPVSPVRLPDERGQDRGALITSVAPGSPAAKAGLKIHDVVIRYDGQDVYSAGQLMQLVRDDKPGRDVAVTFLRADQLMETQMTLGQAPAADLVQGAGFLSELERRFTFRLAQSWRDWFASDLPSFKSVSKDQGRESGTRR